MQISWTDVSKVISSVLGQTHHLKQIVPVTGGSINSSFKACSDHQCFFIKINTKAHFSMFRAEEIALLELASQASIRVPQPICIGQNQKHSFIVMEFLSMIPASEKTLNQLGEQLAKMHYYQKKLFGWQQNNTIGLTKQINTFSDDWTQFWQKNRLGFQLEQAKGNGMPLPILEKGLRLQQHIPVFFTDYNPYPSLLHGDLWGGNMGSDKQGKPVIFDPAIYYGDRETDLAMTELFGGFSAEFYQAYNSILPVDSGYSIRKRIYNLYHLLNHFNLFGGSYLSQVESTLDRVLPEIKA